MTGMRTVGIGAMLTEAREARGITLDQAERETRIQRRYLVALEQEDFAVFPAEVYARGFLRSYAGYLHLNADALLALMPRTGEGGEASSPPHAGRQPRAQRPAGRAKAAPTDRRLAALRLAVPVLAALLLALVAGRLASTGPSPLSAMSRLGGRGPLPTPPVGAGTEAWVATQQMPDLRGMDESTALGRLQELGITPFVIEVPSREGPAGTVIRQSPPANEPVGERVVTIVISRGG